MENSIKPKISIIIPVFNGEKYVESCIAMLQGQTVQNGFEVIFVNDGSNDKTFDIIQKFLDIDSRIRVISQENQGISSARNHGIEVAKGEWLVFVDVDDEVAPGYIEDILGEIEKASGADVHIYARHYVEKNKKVIDSEAFTRYELLYSLLTEVPLNELGTDFLLFAAWSKAYRSSFLKENQISFVEGLKWGEDLVFQCAVFQKAKEINFVYRGFYRYVQNRDSTIHRMRKDDTETIKKMQVAIEKELGMILKEELINKAYYKYMLNAWFIGISSELRAWKKEESILASYMRLKRVLKEALLQNVMKKISICDLSKKDKFRLLLLQRVPLGYLIMTRIREI